jgi:hypothetical protein
VVFFFFFFFLGVGGERRVDLIGLLVTITQFSFFWGQTNNVRLGLKIFDNIIVSNIPLTIKLLRG